MTGSSPRSRSASSSPAPPIRKTLLPGVQLGAEQPGGRLGAGHDVLVVGVHAELAQLLADLLRRTGGVVGDERQVHAAGLRRVQRLGGSRHGVGSDVDDAVEVEDRDVVGLPQRAVRAAEHASLAEGLLELRSPIDGVGVARHRRPPRCGGTR